MRAREVSAVSEQLPPGGIQLSPAEIDALGARWSSCWTPNEVAHRLTGIATPWYVAGGWALDLFRGAQTREHGDIEIGIPAASFPEVRDSFPGYVFDAVSSGRIWANATPDVLAATHQTWLLDPATGDYLVPELVLLFKAKNPRSKDQADFDATVPHMTAAQRETFAELLARVHPGHRWLDQFDGPQWRLGGPDATSVRS
jgi:hypothetical protein